MSISSCQSNSQFKTPKPNIKTPDMKNKTLSTDKTQYPLVPMALNDDYSSVTAEGLCRIRILKMKDFSL